MKTASKTRTVLQGGVLIWLLIFIPFIQAQTAAPTWTQLSLASAPVGREGHSAVYDAANNRMIVFGGRGISGNLPNEVWVLSNADGVGGSPSWTLLIAGSGPSARSFHSAVYDPANNRMIVFGGEPLSNDVWVLSNANGMGGTPIWTLLPAAGTLPSPRLGHSAVYDAANNRMIIFAGETNLGVTFDDVWVLSHANGLGGAPTWMLLSPISATMPRELHSAVYDPASNRMIVFGGVVNFALAHDVQVLSNANGLGGTPAWTVLSPTGAMVGRDMHSAVYDAANNRMTVFGGIANFALANDVWTLSNANGLGGTPAWTQLTPNAGPTVRRSHSAVYHSANNRMIVFGGFTGTGVIWANDTWVLSSGGLDPDPTVQILIEPGENPRPPTLEIEPGALFDVAILSSPTFNALTMVDRTSLTFGRTGNEASIAFCYDSDKDGEGVGMRALICRFSIQQAGFHPGDTIGVLMGRTVTGTPFRATDSIRIAAEDEGNNNDNKDDNR